MIAFILHFYIKKNFYTLALIYSLVFCVQDIKKNSYTLALIYSCVLCSGYQEELLHAGLNIFLCSVFRMSRRTSTRLPGRPWGWMVSPPTFWPSAEYVARSECSTRPTRSHAYLKNNLEAYMIVAQCSLLIFICICAKKFCVVGKTDMFY